MPYQPNMTIAQKGTFLSNINNETIEDIIQFIDDPQIGVDIDNILSRLNNEKKSQLDLVIKRREVEAKKNKILVTLGVLTDTQIIEFIDQGIISDSDLESRIESARLRSIQNLRIKFGGGFEEWEGIPPPGENRTDVFILGLARSGKSCMLASILMYANRKGFLRPDNEMRSSVGTIYQNALLRAIKFGILPPPTYTNAVNYIACDFINKKNNRCPLNLVEMSGELFQKVYNSKKENFPLNGKAYFEGPNKKIIFLAIDYSLHEVGNNLVSDIDQCAVFLYAMGMFKAMGSFRNVKGVCIVLTQFDKAKKDFVNSESEEIVKKVLSENYLSLLNTVKEYSKSYGFEYRVYDFSLGFFEYYNVYNYEMEYAENLYDFIVSKADEFVEPKKGFRFFGSRK